MASPSKQKGSRLERKIVELFQEAGIPCQRAWGSNGLSLGEAETVDNIAEFPNAKLRIQAKARKKIAEFMRVPEGCDATILKADRQEPVIVMNVGDFLEFIAAHSEPC